MRYPPESQRFLAGTTCTQQIKNDDRAQRRLADQMVMQTSGEYGKFLVDTDSKAVKLNSGKIPSQTIKRSQPETTSTFFDTKENSDRFLSARPGTGMDLTFNRSKSELFANTRNSYTAANNSRTQYMETLKTLDRQFDRGSRKDLFAASLPLRSNKEQIYTVTGNHFSAQQSKVWTEKLRHSSARDHA